MTAKCISIIDDALIEFSLSNPLSQSRSLVLRLACFVHLTYRYLPDLGSAFFAQSRAVMSDDFEPSRLGTKEQSAQCFREQELWFVRH